MGDVCLAFIERKTAKSLLWGGLEVYYFAYAYSPLKI